MSEILSNFDVDMDSAKTDNDIADALEVHMENALEAASEVTMIIGEIYATSMLFAYNKWLGMRYSSRDTLREFLALERDER